MLSATKSNSKNTKKDVNEQEKKSKQTVEKSEDISIVKATKEGVTNKNEKRVSNTLEEKEIDHSKVGQPEKDGSKKMTEQLTGTIGTDMIRQRLENMNAFELITMLQTKTTNTDLKTQAKEDPIETGQFLKNLASLLSKPIKEGIASKSGDIVITETKTIENETLKTKKTVDQEAKLTKPIETPMIRNLDVPYVLDVGIKDKLKIRTVESELKFKEGIFNIEFGYDEQIDVDKYQGLKPVTQVAPIVAFKISANYNYTDEPLCVASEIKMLYNESFTVFGYGLQYMQHVFGEQFLNETGLKTLNGKLFLPQLQYTADSVNVQNLSSYIAGNLQFMTVAGWYRNFLATGSNIGTVDEGGFNAPYNGQIQHSVMNFTSPTLYKAVYMRYDLAPWVNTEVMEQMEKVNYKLGKVAETRTQNIVLYSIFALDNIDQYTAGLLNYNASVYLANANNMEFLCARLRSYLLPESKMNWDYSTDELQCYIPPNNDERLQYFITTFCLAPQSYQRIYQYHATAMEAFLSPIPINEVVFFDDGENISQQEKILQNLFETKRADVHGVASFEKLILMQMIPPIHHLRVVTSCLIPTPKPDANMATLTILSLYSLYFPLTFMMTIGYVQNWLKATLHLFGTGQKELGTFFGNKEVGYRNDGDGGFEFKRADSWKQEYYDDGWLPLLHGAVYFPTVFPKRTGRLLEIIVRLFSPIGIWVPDSTDAINSHPRVTDKHYIPFQIDYSETSSPLMIATQMRMTDILRVYQDKSLGPIGMNAGSTGIATMSRVLSNVISGKTTDFNYCLHAHVSHWLHVVANTGMAVLKNFPDNVFESPYSTYVLKGQTTTHSLTTTDGNYGMSVADQIDYNAILPIILSFRTPVLKQANPDRAMEVMGPVDSSPFKYQNVREAYLTLFNYDENFYQTMEVLTYLRGMIDLMTLDRESIMGSDAVVYEDPEAEENPGALLGTIKVITPSEFLKSVERHINMYGHRFDDLLVLDANATIEMFDERMEDYDYPKIFILSQDIDNAVKVHMLNVDLPFFLYATHDMFDEVYNDSTEYISRKYDVGFLIQDIYPDINLKKLLDPENHTKNIVGSTWKQMLKTLADGMGLNSDVLNHVKNFDTVISTKMDVGAKIIRRQVCGRILPFDPAIDPMGIRHYLFGMNERVLNRLKIVQNVVNNKMLPQIMTGILIIYTKPTKCLFYTIFDETGIEYKQYVDGMIGFISGPDNQKLIRTHFDDVYADWTERPNRIIIEMTLKQLYNLPSSYRQYIKEGILSGKCGLKLIDYKYTFEVVNTMAGVGDWASLIPDNYSFAMVGHLKLFDTTSSPMVSSSMGISGAGMIKYVYPLQDLRQSFPVMGIEASTTKRAYSKIQLDHLYDTGIWEGYTADNPINRYTDDDDVNRQGQDKLLGTDRLSTSNYVTTMRSSSLSSKPFKYSVINPKYEISQ